MNSNSQMLRFYSSILANRFKRLAKPLEESFGLNSLVLTITNPSDHFVQITNRPKESEFYINNSLYKYNPFIFQTHRFSHNQTLIPGSYQISTYNKAQKFVKKNYGLEHFLCVYKKENDQTYVIAFSSNNNNLPLHTIFLNHRTLLNKFADYLLEEWAPYLKQMDAYMIHPGKIEVELPAYKANLDPLAQALGLAQAVTFSKQEAECIRHFLMGKTAKEIAQKMQLSYRTIEYYLNNIKSKAGCSNKSELFNFLLNCKNVNL